MAKFTSDGFRPIEAHDATEAARIFAGRYARREYGKRGYARTLRHDCQTEDGRSHTFEAFIGVDRGVHETVGRNVWVYVGLA